MVRMILGVLVAVVMVAVAVPVSAEPVDAGYDIVVLERLPDAFRSRAADINDRGTVVGFSNTGGALHSVLWEPEVIVDLGTTVEGVSRALAVNNRGQIVGRDETAGGQLAYFWEKGQKTSLDPLGVRHDGWVGSTVRDINDRGFAVGNSSDANGMNWAVLWDPDGAVARLEGLDSGVTRALAINNRNQVVGITNSAWEPGASQAYIWSNGVVTRLPTPQGGQAIATDINNRGQAVGFSQVNEEPIRFHAVLWEADGTVVDLGTLGGSSSEAYGINDRGQVVGYSLLPAGSPGCPATLECSRAFLWEDGVMLDLGTLTYESRAFGINNAGEVVGWSVGAVAGGSVVEYAVKWVPSH